MLSVDRLGSLPAKQYFEHFSIEFYLQDAICLFLARKRSDVRTAPEFLGAYLDSVLRGEHVMRRGFKYSNSTPLNRRAFVRLLRQGLQGIPNPESTALTAHDFHDLVAHVCGDFPLAIVLEAARHAKRADGGVHHLVGETNPFGSARGSTDEPTGTGSSLPASNALLQFESLLRLVEFCFVYSELLGVLKHMFQEKPSMWPPRSGSTSSATALAEEDKGDAHSATSENTGEPLRWLRLLLVKELRFYGSTLAGAAMPSERALVRLLRHGTRVQSSGGYASVTFQEALAEMAEHFELSLELHRQDLFGGMLQPATDEAYRAQRLAAAGYISAELQRNSSRRRDRSSQKVKGKA
mmetsp:Transcript_30567/g.59967  ORF Transcript_30567/g.59967 Transcript_30567/m.59967 type:complete len:352 (-) Transcript_30567:43-1098(-)